MNLLSAAERLAAMDHSAVTLDPGCCLHARDRFSSCQACFDMCPAKAIEPGRPPSLNAEKCQTCLACLPICPVGAYKADDAVPSLLNSAARLEGRALELVCERHTSAQEGVSTDAVGIRIRGCLAGLGSGTYLVLAAIGIQHIIVRTEACAGCPWSGLEPLIQDQIARAQQLLSAWGREEAISSTSTLSVGQERPLWEAENPPLSRRDLFRMAARQGQVAIARAMITEQHAGERRPGRDYLRIANAARHLPAGQSNPDLSLVGMGFASLSVSEDCIACGACARACPTAALMLETNASQSRYRLIFSPIACVACEICAHVCASQALAVDHAPTFAQVFEAQEPVVLREGDLARCAKCNSLFAARPGVRLCPLCDFRRKNPLGAMMPPGVKRIIWSSSTEAEQDH